MSTDWTMASLFAFHILIARSAVPAPEARRLFCQGHQARAFTAAWCSLKVDLALSRWPEVHSFIKLSFPPEARVLPNKLTQKKKFLETHIVLLQVFFLSIVLLLSTRFDWNLRITVIWPREAANLSLMATNFWNQMFSPSNVAVHYLPGTAATR